MTACCCAGSVPGLHAIWMRDMRYASTSRGSTRHGVIRAIRSSACRRARAAVPDLRAARCGLGDRRARNVERPDGACAIRVATTIAITDATKGGRDDGLAPVPLVFSRDEIVAGLSCTHLRRLNALLAPRSARAPSAPGPRLRRASTATAASCSRTPRSRTWMRDIDQHWPYWFFFLDPRVLVAAPADAVALPARAHHARTAGPRR